MTRLLTTAEFGERAGGKCTRTVRNWLNGKKIHGRKVGRDWLIAEAELDKIAEGAPPGDHPSEPSPAVQEAK